MYPSVQQVQKKQLFGVQMMCACYKLYILIYSFISHDMSIKYNDSNVTQYANLLLQFPSNVGHIWTNYFQNSDSCYPLSLDPPEYH